MQRAVPPSLEVELPTASMMGSNPKPPVGEESRKADPDMVVGEDARSLELKAARILSKAVASMWKVHCNILYFRNPN
jgi:hypothetical protein